MSERRFDSAGGERTGGGGADGYGAAGAGGSLERYLDGLMDAAERREFEARVQGDAALRAQVSLQAEIDRRLRERFAPPASIPMPSSDRVAASDGVRAEARAPGEPAIDSGVHANGDALGVEASQRSVAASEAARADRAIGGARHISDADAGPISIERAGRASKRGAPSRWVGLAAAACVVLAGGAGAAYWWFVIGQPAPFRQPGEIYAAQAAASFTPEWVCTTDEEFAKNVADRFGHRVILPLGTPGVEIVGWAYGTPVLSRKTATLITRVDGREVLVLIDDAANDVNLRQVGAGGARAGDLHLYKRRVDGLVLYEVSPLDGPRVIQSFVRGV